MAAYGEAQAASIANEDNRTFTRLALARLASASLIGLLAGSGLGVTLLEANLDDSGSFYTEYKQLVIRAYTVTLPLFGLGEIHFVMLTGLASGFALLVAEQRLSRQSNQPTS